MKVRVFTTDTPPEHIDDIDAELAYGDRTARLGSKAREVRALVQRRTGGIRFNIVVGKVMLVDCQIASIDGDTATIRYLLEAPAPRH